MVNVGCLKKYGLILWKPLGYGSACQNGKQEQKCGKQEEQVQKEEKRITYKAAS